MSNICFLRGPFTLLRTWQDHETRGPEYKVMDFFLHSTGQLLSTNDVGKATKLTDSNLPYSTGSSCREYR